MFKFELDAYRAKHTPAVEAVEQYRAEGRKLVTTFEEVGNETGIVHLKKLGEQVGVLVESSVIPNANKMIENFDTLAAEAKKVEEVTGN